MRGFIRAGLRVSALPIAILALLASAGAASAAPTLTSVTFNQASATTVDLTVDGTGFGTNPPPASNAISGYTGSDYGNSLYVCDLTGDDSGGPFCAGQNIGGGGDVIGLVISSWTNTTFEMQFGSAYPLYFQQGTYVLYPPDQISVTVEGATCSGPIPPLGQPLLCGSSGGAGGATVVTTKATNIQSTSATLNGTVNANGLGVVDCQFLYTGPSIPGTGGVSCNQDGSGSTSPVPVSAPLQSLVPGVYHFQLEVTVATSGLDVTTEGATQTFTVGVSGQGQAPTVALSNPTNITAQSVTVNGTVNPNGSPITDCHFFYQIPSEPLAGETDAPCRPASITGSSPVQAGPESFGLLAYSTVFLVGLSATNSAGTTTVTGLVKTASPNGNNGTFYIVPGLTAADKQKLLDLANQLDADADGMPSTGDIALSPASVIADSPLADIATELIVWAGDQQEHQTADKLRTIAQHDPPLPDYQQIAVPVFPVRVTVGRRVPALLRRVLQSWVDNGRQLAAHSGAYLVSYERAQGAELAGDALWTQRQIAATAQFAHATASDMRSEARILIKLRAAFRRMGLQKVSFPIAQAQRLKRFVELHHGLPKAMTRLLVRARATPADLGRIRATIIATPARRLAGPVFERLVGAASVVQLRSTAAVLDGYAAQAG